MGDRGPTLATCYLGYADTVQCECVCVFYREVSNNLITIEYPLDHERHSQEDLQKHDWLVLARPTQPQDNDERATIWTGKTRIRTLLV